MMMQGRFQAAYDFGEERLQDSQRSMEALAVQLNTLVTESTWNPEDESLDGEMESLARELLLACLRIVETQPSNPSGWQGCGQAHFSLAYLFALRGKPLAAARRATLAIDDIEQAVALAPGAADPLLHLGILYYYADNLPGFVKVAGRVLWFVPRGKGDLALDYLRRAACCGESFSEGARFILADILAKGRLEERREAVSILQAMIEDYPTSLRLHYNLLEAIDSLGEPEKLLEAYAEAVSQAIMADEVDLACLEVWKARALMALDRLEEADLVLSGLEGLEVPLPGWLGSVVSQSRQNLLRQQLVALR